MAFDSTILGVWQFNDSLDEEVLNADFVAVGGIPFFGTFQKYDLSSGTTTTEQGLIFGPATYSAGTGFDFVDAVGIYAFNIAFWWVPSGPVGFIAHTITNNSTTKVVPILAKADTTTASGIEQISGSNGEFLVSEVAVTNSTNAIQVSLCEGNGNPTHIFTSESYIPGVHHVFINFSTETQTLRIDIDGIRGNDHRGPSNIASTSATLRLNSVEVGYTAHKATQTGGIISDLVIRQSDKDSSDAMKMFRYGWEKIAETEFTTFNYTYSGISYKQPATITTNQIFVSSGSIYVARSNGDLLLGSRPIWDKEFNFENPDVVLELTISKVDDETPSEGTQRTAKWTTRGLRLEGTTVRI